MKNLLLTVAFVFATAFSFASTNEVEIQEDFACWWETYILNDGSELDSYACSSDEHYRMHLLALE